MILPSFFKEDIKIILFVTEQITYGPCYQLIGNEILYTDARSSTSISTPTKEDQLLEDFEEISLDADQSPDETLDQSDDETSSSQLTELSRSLSKCKEI